MAQETDAGEQLVREEAQAAVVTRSEEELKISTRRRVIGKVRVRKVIVHDEVTITVPIRREELRVEHEEVPESVQPPQLAGELGEGEQVIVLREEVPVVSTKAVPSKRVHVTKEVLTEHRRVSGTVQKEQVDAEGAPPAAGERGPWAG